jgi:hypothetical protein
VKLDWSPHGLGDTAPVSWRADGASVTWLVMVTPDGRVLFTWWPRDAADEAARMHHALANAATLGKHGLPFAPEARGAALREAKARAQNRENAQHSGKRTA